MELGARVAEALLAGAESTEVLDGLGDDIVVELEVDAAGAGCEREVSAWSSSSCWIDEALPLKILNNFNEG